MEISENQISGKGLLTGRDPSFSTEIYPRTAPNSCKKNNMENLLKIYEIRKKNKKSPNMGNLHATRIFRKFCNFFYRVTSSFCHTVRGAKAKGVWEIWNYFASWYRKKDVTPNTQVLSLLLPPTLSLYSLLSTTRRLMKSESQVFLKTKSPFRL